MKIIRDRESIDERDLPMCKKIIDRIRIGDRVIGNPALGLKETLEKREKELEELQSSQDPLSVLNVGDEINDEIRLLRAGIKGEETLAEYIEQVVKHDPELQHVIFFASMSDPNQNSGGEDYTSDSDFVAVYGDNILIIDAKNIATNPEIPLYLDGNTLCAAGGTEVLELHSANYIWRNILAGLPVASIEGCAVIVNKRGATIWKNKEWHKADVKPIHLSDFVLFLHNWIKDKTPETHLSLLLRLSKMQIKKEDPETTAIRNNMRRFGI